MDETPFCGTMNITRLAVQRGIVYVSQLCMDEPEMLEMVRKLVAD